MSKVVGIILLVSMWAILHTKGQLSLEEPNFPEDTALSNHNLWIQPTVQIITSWKSGGRIWSGPWNYGDLARQVWICWYCNVWLGVKYPEIPSEDTESDNCAVGDRCHPVFEGCCEKNEDLICLPKEDKEDYQDITKIMGICKKSHCVFKDNGDCSAKKKCCPGKECTDAEDRICSNCNNRNCRTAIDNSCCDRYVCNKQGKCDCERFGKHCSATFGCCPPFVCSSTTPVYVEASPNGLDPICAQPSNCANGKHRCPQGKVCVNDVCVSQCIKENFSCGMGGDNRKCCNKNHRCQNTCANKCSGHFQNYCSDKSKPTKNCKCGELSACRYNRDCHGGTCCIYPGPESSCENYGACYKLGRAIIGCLYGDDEAITTGRVESVPWSNAPSSEGFKRCPTHR